MEAKIKELKQTIADTEESLKDSAITADAELVTLLNEELDKAKKELEGLEKQTEKKVEVAENAVAKAEKSGTKADVKEAKSDLKEAKDEKKEVKAVAEKVEAVSAKVDKAEEKAKSSHGGAGRGQGRKTIPKMVKPKGQHGGKRPNAGAKKLASSNKKMVKPTGVKVTVVPLRKKKAKKKLSVREKLIAKKVAPKKLSVREKMKAKQLPAKVVKATPPAKAKVKSVRAFGQTVEYKNDADFCSQLIKAFKKRKVASKKDGKRRKTKPVFGVIVNSTKNAVSKALHSVSTKQIEKNPKQFLAKATRLEKSAVRFLEDFKAILGSDYKKSEISAEFGELEKAIKSWVTKFTKK